MVLQCTSSACWPKLSAVRFAGLQIVELGTVVSAAWQIHVIAGGLVVGVFAGAATSTVAKGDVVADVSGRIDWSKPDIINRELLGVCA